MSAPESIDERRRPRNPLLIGITGPIGCGKSTVGRMLAELGGTVIDADVLARRATEPGRATLLQIRDRFGDDVFGPDGELDRAAMARVVFSDPAALADLERIVHPEVRTLVEEQLRIAAADDVPFVVIEAIKLVEGGLANRCDEVWLVECRADTQRERLLGRGDPDEDATRRIETQGPNLIGRLEALLADINGPSHPRVRRVSTDRSLDDLTNTVEDLLAEALLGE
jgi:dephospho-CoA kinase